MSDFRKCPKCGASKVADIAAWIEELEQEATKLRDKNKQLKNAPVEVTIQSANGQTSTMVVPIGGAMEVITRFSINDLRKL